MADYMVYLGGLPQTVSLPSRQWMFHAFSRDLVWAVEPERRDIAKISNARDGIKVEWPDMDDVPAEARSLPVMSYEGVG